MEFLCEEGGIGMAADSVGMVNSQKANVPNSYSEI